MNTELIIYYPNLLSNGSFDKDLSGWTASSGWSWVNGSATHSTGATSTLTQPILQSGKSYVVRAKIQDRSSGNIVFYAGTASSSTYTTNGFLEFTISANSEDFVIQASSGFDGSVNAIKVVEEPIGEFLSLKDDIEFPITYNIADIRQPDKRATSFSKTITIPGDKINNKAFSNSFDIDGEGRFNKNKALEVVVIQDGEEVFNGVLKLESVKIKDFEDIEYDVSLRGKLSSIYLEWGEKKMNEIDISEYNHYYTFDYQKGSWKDWIAKNGASYSNYTISNVKTFSDTSWETAGYLGLVFTASHGFVEGDRVYVDKTNKLLNPQYDGYFTIIDVPSTTKIILNNSFGNSSTLEGGTIYKWEPTGEGYVYPQINYGFTDGSYYKVENNYPAIYAKTYIDKYFKLAKFTYQSNFFNSSYFKHLIIPYNSESFKLSEQQMLDRMFQAEHVATQSFTYSYSLPNATFSCIYSDDYNNSNFDTQNVWNTSNSKWTVNDTGNYSFKTTLKLDFQILPDVLGSGGYSYFFTNYLNALTTIRIKYTGLVKKKDIYNNITTIASNSATWLALNPSDPVYGWSASSTVTPTTLETFLLDVEFNNQLLQAGEQIWVETNYKLFYHNNYNLPVNLTNGMIFFIGFGTWVSGKVWMRVLPTTFCFNRVDNQTLNEGAEVNMNDALPDKFTIKDFFNSLVKMFNLYVDVDKDNERKLIIEPREDFYNTTNYVDWTNKTDSKELQFKPMAELGGREYYFSYKEDKDFLNDDYTKKYEGIYGDKEVFIDNDFTNAKVETKLTFSPTVLQDKPDNSDRIIPNIFASDNGIPKPVSSNLRILFYGGVQYTYFNYNYLGISATYSLNTYPYSGHLDSARFPTEDLNFGFPKGLYYDYLKWTDNNLYNKYYKNYIEEITDRNACIVIGNFNLTPIDISTLDFRKPVFVDGHWLRLNKVSDYSAVSRRLTKCEFTKIYNKPRFKKSFIHVIGGSGEAHNGNVLPSKPGVTLINGNAIPHPTTIIRGNNVNVHATVRNSSIIGDNITVHQDSRNITIGGGSTNITILGGLENITVIGTSDLVITESNVTYINGMQVINGTLVNTSINLIDAGQDEVLNPFGAYTSINLIDAGQDKVLGLGSSSPINLIDGGEG